MTFRWRFQKLKYDYQRARLSEINIIIFRQMSHPSEVNVFFEEKHESTEHLLASRPSECPDSIPYLKKGDSNSYLDQFLIIKEEQPEVAEPSNKEESRQASVSNEQDEEYLADEQVKFTSSSFHNFQKHLTVCLKHSIDIQTPENPSQHHLAASKLWKAFKTSNFSTKKILHYLLGEKNEHRITQEGLQQYGFAKIYEAYDEKVMSEARRYLSDCTLKQIKQGKLKEYLDGKKLKDKDRFRRYVEIFTNELSNGFLRKRLPKESVHYLQNL